MNPILKTTILLFWPLLCLIFQDFFLNWKIVEIIRWIRNIFFFFSSRLWIKSTAQKSYAFKLYRAFENMHRQSSSTAVAAAAAAVASDCYHLCCRSLLSDVQEVNEHNCRGNKSTEEYKMPTKVVACPPICLAGTNAAALTPLADTQLSIKTFSPKETPPPPPGATSRATRLDLLVKA